MVVGRPEVHYAQPRPAGRSAWGTLRGDDRRQREQNWFIGRVGHGLEVVGGNTQSRQSRFHPLMHAVYRLIVEDSIDERVVQLSGFKAELSGQLARHSALAEAASREHTGPHEVNEGELLSWARDRYSM